MMKDRAAERALRTRIAGSVDAIRRSFVDNLFYVTGRTLEDASDIDRYTALAHSIRARLLARLVPARRHFREAAPKQVAYMSAEYLLGPQLGNNILSLKLWRNVEEAMQRLDLDLETLLECEEEPGLGNGGLGRLAACYMDSLATLEIPAIGYGIRYEYGIFEQSIKDGWQVEVADAWLRMGNPWELRRHLSFPVKFGGHVERVQNDDGSTTTRWVPDSVVYGLAYDMPILGHGVLNVNLLRLWKSVARESFDFQAFNIGDYYGAVDEMVAAQNISNVLYPNDDPASGKELRLCQQYFLVSCSLQDMIRVTLRDKGDIRRLSERFVVQLNDTHPALAIPELMRLLMDEHKLSWEPAWEIVQECFAYTNHTLLPEALETWPVELLERLLPRHMEIIYEINLRFLDDVRVQFINEPDRLVRMSLIDEGDGRHRRVRMANLACVGSRTVNGVARLHSELLRTRVMKDFYEMWPEKFQNKTNGVTPRRFIALANPPLASLLTEVVEGDWLLDLDKLRQLEKYVEDRAFHDRWRSVKREAKERLAAHVQRKCGVDLDPDSLFDVQVKRMHEYKRQHLNILNVIHLYHRLKEDQSLDIVPRSFVFGGKAAPGYFMAKLMIKLITSVADVLGRDPQVGDLLKVVFVPDFDVTLAQRIYPAADLSEQISMAGTEASGTGNMKFTMNGALTIGTLDGANIEIREAVGPENFFLFGRTTDEVDTLRGDGYRPRGVYESNAALRSAIDLIDSGHFSKGDRELFRPLTQTLLDSDPYLVFADFQDYVDCQTQVDACYRSREEWTRKSIINVARCGFFSSDRAIREYCKDIWHIEPVPARISD